jgi:hypothetical protein
MSRLHRIRPCALWLEGRATPSCLVYALQDTFVAVDSHVGPYMPFGFNPPPEPALNFVVGLRGGLGVDRIVSRLGGEPTPFAPPVIGCALAMDGGAGNDVLDAQFAADATQQKVADGGARFDIGVFSHGVRHANVEWLG